MELDDINIEISNNIFTCRVAALIENKGRVLVQKRVNDKVWALPGGKLRILEKTEDGIRREIGEELGCDLFNLKLLSVSENFFEMKGKKAHQYIFTYEGNLDTNKYDDLEEFESIEIGKNVIYRWIEIDKLDEFEIRPDNIKEQLEEKKKGNMTFFKCEG